MVASTSLTSLCASERDRPEKVPDLQILNAHRDAISKLGRIINSKFLDMVDSGKKRKRNENASQKPSKKIAIQAPIPVKDVNVSIITGTDGWAPIVASTPGLAISSSIPLQAYSRRRKNASGRSNQTGAIATNELLVQSSSHPTIDYLGREEEGGADSLLKHYLGVYNPTTGKLQVMEARKMVVRGTVRSHEAGPEAFSEEGLSTSMMQLRNDLGQTFGTKKARKAITSLTENAISPNKSARQTSPGGSQRTKMDSVTTAMLESIAEVTGNMATREELSAAVDNAKPRPIANLAAESINDVYTIESLIGSEIIKQIPVKEWRDAVKAGKEIIMKSKFVAHRLQKVATSDVQKLRALRYLLCLLEFFGSARPKGKGIRVLPYKDGLRAAVAGVPEAVLEHIRRKFSVNGQMLKYQTDLLITHACALALVVDNFEVDMYDLREDLHLEVKEISQYFQEIGAKVMAANEVERKRLCLDKAAAAQRKFARLRLPLEFPKLKFARRR